MQFYPIDINHWARGQMFYYFSQMAPPPPNAYTVSCIPWVSFKHFAVHSYDCKPYFFPSVEAGRIYRDAGQQLLPLSITCHHATTDGYHVDRFLKTLQQEMDAFKR